MIFIKILLLITLIKLEINGIGAQLKDIVYCPSQELILPCRCSQKGEEIQVW